MVVPSVRIFFVENQKEVFGIELWKLRSQNRSFIEHGRLLKPKLLAQSES